MVLGKIESSILNGLGYIGRLEKKHGNDRSKYVPAIKGLKIQGLSCFDVVKFFK